MSPDPATIKARQQATWASGDYSRIGATLQIVGETLCEAVDLRAGSRVLDVAAGSGNAALAAARCGCQVTAADYVPELLEHAARRADADGLPLVTRVADAESLPFDDGSFDAVLSTFGVMFAPDQDAAARELLRVCRTGGRIGLASWTPESFIGELFRIVVSFVPPPAVLRSPLLWGSEGRIDELFGADARTLRGTRRHFTFRYRSPDDFVDTFRRYYGPTLRAFEALPPERRPELADAIAALCRRYDRSAGDALLVPGEYLELVLEKR